MPLPLHDSPGALARNNIVLNDGSAAGLQIVGAAPDSDFNCYFPSNSVVPLETRGVYTDPMLHPSEYTLTNLAGSVIHAGEPVPGFAADIGGYARDPRTPCIGTAEVLFDDIGAGRWTVDLAHDGRGRLVSCRATDGQVTNTAAYAYDPFTRRTDMTRTLDGVATVWRFVYDGNDVLAEFVDETGDGQPDRKRVYWLTEDVDRRIGFADITANGVAFYYYLLDQVGTVHRILDDTGAVVNQYQYDAWGNVQWNSPKTFETVENRYLFQGREWDPVGRHYYYRNRTYLPGQRRFDGPDRNLLAGILAETEGYGSDTFCRNDPVNYVDPLGLETEYGVKFGIRFGWDSRIEEFNFTDVSIIATLQDQVSESLSLRADLGYRLYKLGLGTSSDLDDRYSDFWISGSIIHGKGDGKTTKVLTGGPLHSSAIDDSYRNSFAWGQTFNWHSHIGYTRTGHIQIKGDNQYLHYQNDAFLPPTFGGGSDHAWTASLTLGGVLENDVSWTVGWAAFTGLPNLDASGLPQTTGSGTGSRGAHHDQHPYHQAFNRSVWYAGVEKGEYALIYHEPVKPYSTWWNLQNLVHDVIARDTPRFHYSNDDYYQVDLNISMRMGAQ